MEEDNRQNKINPTTDNVKNTVFRTYTEDMAEVLEHDAAGLVKKIIHGEEMHEAERKNLSPQSKKNKFFMFISVIFLFLAFSTFIFFLFNKRPNTIPAQEQFTPIIFNDQIKYFEVAGFTKDQIAQTVLNEVNASQVKSGGVEGIYLTENSRIIGLRRFISLINSNFTPSANTLLVNDNFLMGVASTGATTATNNTPVAANGFFILIKARSIADIFDSMHAWENSMLTDLHGFLGINITSDTNYLFTKDFEDGVVANKNAHILYDTNNHIVLMYIFTGNNSVIITNSEDAANEVMNRLAASQTVQ